MDIILQSLQGVFVVIAVVALGYVLSVRGWITDTIAPFLVKLVTFVSLPIYLWYGMYKNFSKDSMMTLISELAVPALSILIAFVIGGIMVYVFNVRKDRRGIVWTNAFTANTIFIGLPVNVALFGEASMPSVMLYYMANTTFFWTIGTYLIQQSGSRGETEGISIFRALRKLISPPLMGFLVGLATVLFAIPIPKFVTSTAQMVGAMTTPLALMYIGYEISKVSLDELKLDKDMMLGIIGRFLICPACILILLPFFAVSDMSRQVFIIQGAMPAMTLMTIMAKSYEADSQFAATLSFATILLSLVLIPLYMYLISA